MTMEQLRGLLDDYEVAKDEEDVSKILLYNPRTLRWYSLNVQACQRYEESEVKDVLEGKREPQEVFLFTRVVGYYSRTSNWNASKLGELEGRQAGNYWY